MELRSDRVYMRQITVDDWPLFLALHTDQRVTRYVCEIQTQSQAREKFESRLPQWLPGSVHWLCLVMFNIQTGDALGVTGLKVMSPTELVAEVGYMLLTQHQGKGYGSESLRTVMSYAFDTLGMGTLKAVVTEGNLASCRVLEKCGFRLAQRHSNAFNIRGQLFDDLVYYHRVSGLKSGRIRL
ncbi:GNAT family N-acetyltransferase [Pseudomonas sp. TE3610]